MTFALTEPTGDPTDEGDRAAHLAEMDRTVAIRAHAVRVEVGEDQMIGPDGDVLCLWCGEPLESERLSACPTAVRHEECQEDHEQFQRRHR